MSIYTTLLVVVAALFIVGNNEGIGLFFVANAECMDAESSGASITEGAWNVMGVNGTMDPPVLDDNNINTQDSTWTIPDGIWYVITYIVHCSFCLYRSPSIYSILFVDVYFYSFPLFIAHGRFVYLSLPLSPSYYIVHYLLHIITGHTHTVKWVIMVHVI